MALKMMIPKPAAELPKPAGEPPQETAETQTPKNPKWIVPFKRNYPRKNPVLKVGYLPFFKRTFVLHPDTLTDEWEAAVKKGAATDDAAILSEILDRGN